MPATPITPSLRIHNSSVLSLRFWSYARFSYSAGFFLATYWVASFMVFTCLSLSPPPSLPLLLTVFPLKSLADTFVCNLPVSIAVGTPSRRYVPASTSSPTSICTTTIAIHSLACVPSHSSIFLTLTSTLRRNQLIHSETALITRRRCG